MPKVTFIAFDGTQTTVDVPAGENVMRGTLYNSIEGIAGECGGGVRARARRAISYVDEVWTAKVGGAASEAEAELLNGAASQVKPSSRLSCQIVMAVDLYGLVVHLPEKQYD